MADEPTQETPKGHEVPVPKRADVFSDLRKVAKPVEQPSDTGGGSADEK